MKPPPSFRPGFRLSATDVVVLVIGTIGTVSFYQIDRGVGLAIGFVVAHFFLFCNVLRLSRSLELIWAGTFIILAASNLSTKMIPWSIVFGGSALVTVLLAVIDMNRPGYHGMGWRRINPKLPAWWIKQNRTRDSETPSTTSPVVAPGGSALP